ncbi:MAG: ABC transporter substrate-binding protein, partial [Planctomycetota bacterium]|nr:ABC transporter substrate-binding protein [Planctomycetota bacterium]
MVRTLRLVLLAAVALALVVAPTSPGQAEDKKVFRYADNGYAQLDPARASLYRLNDERLIVALQECLTVLDPKTGKAKPGAADSWSPSADRKTWTFKLRKGAKWSDGSPVTAEDFLRAWRRQLDPFTNSDWSWLFRSIQGCATITDNSARTTGFSLVRNGLRELIRSSPNGIPGEELNSLLDDTGVRPFLTAVKSRSMKRMLKWSDDKAFPPEMTKKVIDELKKARRKHKSLWEDEYDVFGTTASGVHAPDKHTLVIKTEGDAPFLPELLARSAFAPLHKSVESKRDQAFQAGDFVNNGPYMLKGRGARPPENQPDKRITSVVELARNPHYNGPNKPNFDTIRCDTDLTLQVAAAKDLEGLDDVRQFKDGKIDWVYLTYPNEYPRKDRVRKKKSKKKRVDLRADIEGLKGWQVRSSPRVIFLRFRCDKAPFNSKDARKAFALALDRKRLAGMYWPKAETAYRIVPPGIDGRVEGIACARPSKSEAKAAFKAAALESDTWVELSFGESPGQGDVAYDMVALWKKTLGIEPGTRIESDQDVRNVLRAGGYQAMVSDYRGFVNDPYGFLAPFHSDDADSGLGWRDEMFDALLDAARDPTYAIENEAEWLEKVGSSMQGVLAGAKSGQAGRAKLRLECLAAAERRLLDEFVVVPLLFMNEAVLAKPGVKDMDGPGALNNPGFTGSLVHVKRCR